MGYGLWHIFGRCTGVAGVLITEDNSAVETKTACKQLKEKIQDYYLMEFQSGWGHDDDSAQNDSETIRKIDNKVRSKRRADMNSP